VRKGEGATQCGHACSVNNIGAHTCVWPLCGPFTRVRRALGMLVACLRLLACVDPHLLLFKFANLSASASSILPQWLVLPYIVDK